MKKKDYKKLAIKKAKTIAKERAGYVCEKCGRSKEEGWQIHGAHIIPVRYGHTAANPDNIISLCGKCHSLGRESAHENPTVFTHWLDAKYPGRADEMWKLAQPTDKVDWKEIYENLSNRE
jgi:5-methylcytosine-specific restriction endonuclease McrA